MSGPSKAPRPGSQYRVPEKFEVGLVLHERGPGSSWEAVSTNPRNAGRSRTINAKEGTLRDKFALPLTVDAMALKAPVKGSPKASPEKKKAKS